MSDSVVKSSARKMFRDIQSRRITSRELVAAHFERIREVNEALNAMVELCEERAMQEAAEADRDLARGLVRGPLHGVPMTIKDLIETQGIVTAAGSQSRATHVPSKDAPVVQRLRAAGAILLGKSNTPELGLSDHTNSPLHGRANNPYDLERTPGGSGGGGAAIVAACGAPFDIGSDVGGSLRQPAGFCGIATIKPTSGRVPTTGHVPPSTGLFTSLNHIGPSARSVDDLSLVLAILSGTDWRDPLATGDRYYDKKLRPSRGLRVAWYVDNGISHASDEVATAVANAVDALARRKCSVAEARPAFASSAPDLHLRLFAADGAHEVRQLLQARGGLLTVGEELRNWLDYDREIQVNDIRDAIADLARLRAGMLQFLRDYELIVCPVSAVPAVRHGELMQIDTSNFQQLYNLTGWPAAVVRCGTSPEGLPIGVQIVGRPWDETTVLEAAAMLEYEFGGWIAPPV